MSLLAKTPPSELPADALLARLRYRRAAIMAGTDASVEASLGDLIDWVFQRLNRRLRKQLEPLLELMAMRHMVLALRYHLVEEKPPEALMRHDLLAESLKQTLASCKEARHLVVTLEKILAEEYPFVAGLTINYQQQGPGGVERQLSEGLLGHTLGRAKHPACRAVLRYLADMRNLLAIRKFWRWQVHQPPGLVAGGSLPVDLLQRVWAKHDESRYQTLARQLTGETARNTQTISTEQILLSGMTRLLHKIGRDPLGPGIIIEYLWRAQLAQHNRLLQRNLPEDRRELLGEVLL